MTNNSAPNAEITTPNTDATILMLANDRDVLREENKTLRETVLMLAGDRDALREEIKSIRKGSES